MNTFAKIFDTSVSQILVVLDHNDEDSNNPDRPTVQVTGINKNGTRFDAKYHLKTEKAAQKAFDDYDQTHADAFLEAAMLGYWSGGCF